MADGARGRIWMGSLASVGLVSRSSEQRALTLREPFVTPDDSCISEGARMARGVCGQERRMDPESSNWREDSVHIGALQSGRRFMTRIATAESQSGCTVGWLYSSVESADLLARPIRLRVLLPSRQEISCEYIS